MNMLFRVSLALALAVNLGAQSPQDLLKLVPVEARHVVLAWNPASLEAKYRAALGELDSKGLFSRSEKETGLGLKDLPPGPMAIASLPDEEGSSVSMDVFFIPVKDSAAFIRTLKASRSGAFWRYQRGSDEDDHASRYFAFRGGYAIIAPQKPLLEKVMKGTAGLEGELASLMPWLASQDGVMVLTEKGTADVLSDLTQGMRKDLRRLLNAGQDGMASPLKEWTEKARRSIHHVAMGLDLKDGSLKASIRAFCKPGSPLAQDVAELRPLAGPLLGVLPDGPFALAMGGRWPGFLQMFGASASLDPALPGAQGTRLKEILEKQAGEMETLAFSLEAPSAGQPLLSGLSAVVRIKDLSVWTQANRARQDLMKDGLGEGYTVVERGSLEGRPCATTSIDLSALAMKSKEGEIPPPRTAMMYALIFGGSRMTISEAALDDHTEIFVFGGMDLLRKTAARVKEGRTLAASAGIRQVDGLLPGGARLGFYVHPKGFQNFLAAFDSSHARPLVDLGNVPPIGGVLTMDPDGIQFTAVARPETIKAFAQVFQTLRGKLKKHPENDEEGEE